MKKQIIAVMVAALSVMSASAYDFWAGGSIGLWRNGSSHTTTFTLAPELGYTLDDKWSVGASLDWDMTHDYRGTGSVFTINPFVRYELLQWDRVSIFCDGGVEIGIVDPAVGNTGAAFGIGLKPGIKYLPTDRIALVAHFGFLGGRFTNHDGAAYYDKGWGFDLDNNVTFGVSYCF